MSGSREKKRGYKRKERTVRKIRVDEMDQVERKEVMASSRVVREEAVDVGEVRIAVAGIVTVVEDIINGQDEVNAW